MNLVYLNSGIGSVFVSQVLGLLQYQQSTGFFKEITLVCGIRTKKEEKILEALYQKSISIIPFKSYPNLPFFNIAQRSEVRKALQKVTIDSDTVFHIRGEQLAFLSRRSIKHKILTLEKIIVDVRGAAIEEVMEFSEGSSLKKRLKLVNMQRSLKNLNSFGKVTVVSNSLNEYLREKNNKLRNIFTIPCAANLGFNYSREIRKEYRRKLDIHDQDILIAFASGGDALWQDQSSLIKLAGMGFKVLNLSPIEIRHPGVISMFVTFDEVPNYFMAADAGLIIREKSIVNKVACPVKFVEYVCCGLPVISNSNVDCITEYINATGNGLLVSEINQVTKESVFELLKKDRSKISEDGRARFGMDHVANLYREVYKEVK